MNKKYATLTVKDRYGSITRHKAPEELFPPHHHEHLEINLVESGHAKYNVNERIYTLEPRCLVFLFPAQEHMLYDRSPDFKMWNITVRQSFLNTFCKNSFLLPLKDRDPETYFCRQLHPSAYMLYERLLLEIAEQRSAHPVMFRIGLSYLVSSIWKDFQENSTPVTHSPISPHVQKAVHLLSHPDAPEGVDTLAKRLNTSPSQISRMFKREMGISITDFRNRQKLDLFTKLLSQNPQHDLLTLAMDANFGSYTQFFRIFRREMGMTPEQFRKKTNL
jgi:AraC-like DNA-binding protein